MQRCRPWFWLLVLGLAGCATTPLDLYLRTPSSLPHKASVAGVPLFTQAKDQCGPAALASALGWAGKPVTSEAVESQLFTPGRKGTLQQDMIGAARRQGFLALTLASYAALFEEIAHGHPVVVLQNLGFSWYPLWHYSVVVGYDLDRRELTLHMGEDEPRMVGFASFARSWDLAERWALVVLPPGHLSPTADDLAHLAAAAALERTGHARAAAKAYRALLERWPRHLGALMGLGNALFTLGEKDDALKTLRDASHTHPKAAMAWHNLAFLYADRKQYRLAKEAAGKALENVGSDQRRRYEESLAPVLSR